MVNKRQQYGILLLALFLVSLIAGLLLGRFAALDHEDKTDPRTQQQAVDARYRSSWEDAYRQRWSQAYRRGQLRGLIDGKRIGFLFLTRQRQLAAKQRRAERIRRQRLVAAERQRQAQQALRAATASASGSVSRETIQFISQFEGFYSRPYNDPAGYATVGYGHLIAYRPVRASDRRAIWLPGQQSPGRLTAAEARRLLGQDLVKYQQQVAERLGGVPLSPEMITALVSFAFNLGPGYLDARPATAETAATNVAAQLRAGKYMAAARQMRIYDGAIINGRRVVLPGLTKRRQQEYRLMLSGARRLGVS